VEREYAVRIIGALDTEKMDALLNGVELDDGVAKVESIVPAGGEGINQWYRLVIKEGRNREVRRLMEHLGLTVSRLIRVRFGPIAMPPRLKRGMKEELAEEEVTALMRWCGLGKGAGGARPEPPERAAGSASPSGAPSSKVGHPYRRRLNTKGERQT
jgi:23S rRNA pseudouridine2605 synthase